MPSQHPHPSQRQYSEVTVRQTGLIPHHLLYHHSPHDRKNDHSCSEYSTRNSDSVATQTPHIHHQARGARLGVNLRNPTPCVYTCLGRGYFFLGESALAVRMYTVFSCASCGFYIIFNFFFTFRGAFRESADARLWTLGTAPLLCYNHYARVRTFISVLPRISAAPPSFSFSLTNIFYSVSSHLTSNFHYQCHSTIPQYLYFYSHSKA